MPMRAIGSFAVFIRNYLLKKKKAYVRQMWKAYNKYLKRKYYRPIKYSSFVRYIKLLKDLGLIVVAEATEEERTPKTTGGRLVLKRTYYMLNPEMIDSKAWLNPFSWRKKK